MSKKMVFVILLAVLLIGAVGSLIAQPPGRGFGGRRGPGFSSFMGQAPLAANEEEKRILSVLEDLDRNQSRG